MRSLATPPSSQRSAPPPPRGCTCFKVRRLARTVSRLYDQHLAESGLRTTQYSLLNSIALGPTPLARLAAQLGLERTTLSRNLKPLIEQKLVTIAAGSDARQRVVRATPRARVVLEHAATAWRRAQAELQETLGVAAVAELHRTLDQTLEHLQPLLSGERHEQ